MNLGAGYPCASAPSKPQPPQPTSRCSMGRREHRAATQAPMTFSYQFTPVALNLLSTYNQNQAAKRAIREAGALINAGLSWQMPVLGHELSP